MFWDHLNPLKLFLDILAWGNFGHLIDDPVWDYLVSLGTTGVDILQEKPKNAPEDIKSALAKFREYSKLSGPSS